MALPQGCCSIYDRSIKFFSSFELYARRLSQWNHLFYFDFFFLFLPYSTALRIYIYILAPMLLLSLWPRLVCVYSSIQKMLMLFFFSLFLLFFWPVPPFLASHLCVCVCCAQWAPRGDADGRAERSWRPGSWASQQRWRSQREQLPTEPIRPLPIAKWRSGHGKKRYTITIYPYIYLSTFTHRQTDRHASRHTHI